MKPPEKPPENIYQLLEALKKIPTDKPILLLVEGDRVNLNGIPLPPLSPAANGKQKKVPPPKPLIDVLPAEEEDDGGFQIQGSENP